MSMFIVYFSYISVQCKKMHQQKKQKLINVKWIVSFHLKPTTKMAHCWVFERTLKYGAVVLLVCRFVLVRLTALYGLIIVQTANKLLLNDVNSLQQHTNNEAKTSCLIMTTRHESSHRHTHTHISLDSDYIRILFNSHIALNRSKIVKLFFWICFFPLIFCHICMWKFIQENDFIVVASKYTVFFFQYVMSTFARLMAVWQIGTT